MKENPALMVRKALALKAHTNDPSKKQPAGSLRNPHQGIERTVYLDKRNGWVFKIERSHHEGANLREYEAYLRGKDLAMFNGDKYPLRLPVTTMVDDVIVQEYVNGRHAGYDEWHDLGFQSAIQDELKVSDVHFQNVILKGAFWFVVDMAWG